MRRVVLTLFATLALLAGGASFAADAVAGDIHYGKLRRGDGVLHHGCHHYRYRYVLRPRAKDWAIELFIKGPGGKTLGNDAFEKGQRPKRGHRHFKICAQTTEPGRFSIHGKMTRDVQTCSTPLTCETVQKIVWVSPAKFRLRHP